MIPSDLIAKLAYRAPDFIESGPQYSSLQSNYRDPYKVDLGRIIHSASFRRLQAKTQVMGTGEGDFHRTRLTHSIEVGQIARGILWRLLETADERYHDALPSSELIEAISYTHDLGHPPFGHGGEIALHKLMLDHGGFEGNAQTLRIITKLEKIYEFDGIKPTRRLLLGILKYPVNFGRYDPDKHRSKPPKCYYDLETDIVQKALNIFSPQDVEIFISLGSDGKPRFKTLDCAIMDLADDIAYGVHDLEDGIGRKILRREAVEPTIKSLIDDAGIRKIGSIPAAQIVDKLFSAKSSDRKYAISEFVNLFVNAVSIHERQIFASPILELTVKLPNELRNLLSGLTTKIIFPFVVAKPELQTLERKGERIISDIFRTLLENPMELIGKDNLLKQSRELEMLISKSLNKSADHPLMLRGVCDFIASMTDSGAMRYHKRLFEPGYGNSADDI